MAVQECGGRSGRRRGRARGRRRCPAGSSPRSIARLRTRAGRVAARLDEACAVVLARTRDRSGPRRPGRDHASVRARARPAGPRGGAAPAGRRAASRCPARPAGGVPLVVERVEGERLLARPPAVDRGLADAGALGDLVHAHRLETVAEQQLGGGGEDRRRAFSLRGRPRRFCSAVDGCAHDAASVREHLVERCDVAVLVAEPLGLRQHLVGGVGRREAEGRALAPAPAPAGCPCASARRRTRPRRAGRGRAGRAPSASASRSGSRSSPRAASSRVDAVPRRPAAGPRRRRASARRG